MTHKPRLSLSLVVYALRIRSSAALAAVMLVSLLTLPASLHGQADSPLTLDQVHNLLSIDAPDSTIAHEIQSRGIAFVPSKAQLDELERQHAGIETLAALRKFLPAESTLCETFGGCMGGGQHAYHDKNWSQALAYFQQATIISPNSSQAWDSEGHSYLALGHTKEAYAAWDKAIDLPNGIGLTSCMENHKPVCEGGTLRITSSTIVRLKGSDKVFEAPLSAVKLIGMIRHNSPSYLAFELTVNGVKYDFDFFPVVGECVWSNVLVCPTEGQQQQASIGNYLTQTIRRLTSNEAGGTTVVVPFEPSAVTEAPPLRISVRHRHKPVGWGFTTPESITYCQGLLAIHMGIVQFDCTVPDNTTQRCDHAMISPVRNVQYKDGGLRIVGQGGNWDFFGNNDDLSKAHDAIAATITPTPGH
jgi:hypothetical protein